MGEENKGKLLPEDRGCTDILCCLLFIAAIVVFIALAIVGFSEARIDILTAVFDSSNRPCGVNYKDDDFNFQLGDYKYLYFTTLNANHMPYKSVCVKSCPSEDKTNNTVVNLDWNIDGNVNVTNKATVKCDLTQVASNDAYAAQTDILCYYKTTTLLNRFCIPGDSAAVSGLSSSVTSKLDQFVNNEQVQEWIDSVDNAKYIILASFFIAFVVGGVYMVIVRYLAGILVWITIILFIALEVALAAYCLNRSDEYLAEGNQSNSDGMKYLSYIIFAIAAATAVLVLCMFRKIQLGIAIIKTAALYVGDVKTSMIVPVITAVFVLIWIIVWIVVFVYAVGNFDTFTKDPNYPIAQVTWNDTQTGTMWYILFVGLWINAFIQAFQQFILVGSVCIWYYERENLHSPLTRPFWWGLRKHLGSLAFGSFLLALVQLIRIILAYIEQQSKRTMGDNKLAQCLIKCLQCYAACFERFIKFLNRNAYIQIALKGTNFCTSARAAMSLLWDNAGRASIVQGIGGMFIFIGNGFISLLTLFICYIILTTGEDYKSFSPWLPLGIIFVLSFTVAILFMSIYGMAIDAIFVCFCQDEADNKGGQAQHTPNLLKEFLDSNVEVKKEGEKK